MPSSKTRLDKCLKWFWNVWPPYSWGEVGFENTFLVTFYGDYLLIIWLSCSFIWAGEDADCNIYIFSLIIDNPTLNRSKDIW